MLIAQLGLATNERSGDWFYRTHAPGLAMSRVEDVWVIDAPHIHRARSALLAEADVLVINMVPDVDLRPAIAARRQRGLPTVFELNDDVAHLHPLNPYARFYADPYEVTKLKQLLAACDAVQFCTPELHRIYGSYARRSAIFMNQMPPRQATRPPRGKKMIVGWGGSAGHLPDLAWAAPALTRWVNRRADVELRVMGDPALFALFAGIVPERRRHIPVGDIAAYYNFVSEIDVGIAPLQDTPFNRSRSDVKFLEYALHGAVPVVQDLAPYRETVRHGETGLLVAEPDALVEALDRLASSPSLRARIAASAAAYVEAERGDAIAATQRLTFYRSLLPAGDEVSRPARAQSVAVRLAAIEGTIQRGRHLELGFGGYEELVRRALALAHEAARPESLDLLEQAAALEPTAYQPYVFGALFGGRARRRAYLEKALAREPRSLSCWIDLGDELDDAGDSAGALRAYAGAAQIEPTFDLAYAKTSLLLSKLGRHADAQKFGAIAQQIQQRFLA